MQGEIRPGYKQTEVGVIPEDWQVCKTSQLGTIVTGGTPSTQNRSFWNGNFPWVTPTDISGKRDIFTSERMVSLHGLQNIRELPAGSVLVTCIASIGKNAILRARGGCNQQINAIIPNSNNESNFLFYLLEHSKGRLLASAGITATLIISKGVFSEVYFAIPPLSEQRAIAAALSDADGLIAALEGMIAKKRDLKQAAMQHLLTGKTRLPGFSGEWEVKRLGELLEYEQPTKYLVSSTDYDDSYDIPVLTAGKSFLLGHTNESHGAFTQLPVIIFDDFTTATQFVDFPFKAKSSAMKLLKPRNAQVNLRLVYDMMQTIEFVMSDHKRYWISEYQKIEVPFPDGAEQTAIAEVLSDMDADLAALEAQAAKARAVKQGMMQELLTGRVRLL